VPSYSSSSSHPQLPPVRRPPKCRLPMSSRFLSFIVYVTFTLLLLSSTTLAAPTSVHHIIRQQLHNRQAIPDKTGQTGNKPAPVKSDTPCVLIPPSATPCTASSIPMFTFNPSSTQQPSPTSLVPVPGPDPGPGNEGNTSGPPGQLGLNPLPPSRPLALVSSDFPLTPGRIAGIAGGSSVLLCILAALGVWIWRRRRVDVNEIPIRRSRLVSRLGFRVFGDKPVSGSPSRRGSHASNDSKASWLVKGSIGRPKPAWMENGLLSVPKPGFLDERGDDSREPAPWNISRPKPSRPRSAEPLGRLSGMGLGMGYLR
jgi:hypothetical protein